MDFSQTNVPFRFIYQSFEDMIRNKAESIALSYAELRSMDPIQFIEEGCRESSFNFKHEKLIDLMETLCDEIFPNSISLAPIYPLAAQKLKINKDIEIKVVEREYWKSFYINVLDELKIYQIYDMRNEVLYERLERERQEREKRKNNIIII